MTDEQQRDEGQEEGAQSASATEQDSGQDQEQAEAGGGDTAEGKAEQQSESDTEEGAGQAEGGSSAQDDDEVAKAKKAEEEREQAAETMKKIEEDPPEKIEDWPDDKSKYETFGGPEGEHSYAEGPEEEALGPSSLRHHEDGKVSIAGEEVDDPDEYKGEPIPGGPTDPNAPDDSVAAKTKIKMEQEQGADFGEAASDKMDSQFVDSEGESKGDSGDEGNGAKSEDEGNGAKAEGDDQSDEGNGAKDEEREEAGQQSQ